MNRQDRRMTPSESMKPSAWLAAVLAATVVVLFGCATAPPAPKPAAPSKGPADEQPMYGGQDRQSNPELKAADEALIQSTAKEYGTRSAASERFVVHGFRYYAQDDLANATKLFNQGWLLDPQNPNVYWGFAAVLNDRQEFCEARTMMERAIEFGLIRPEGLADGGRLNTVCAMQRGVSAETKAAYVRRSQNLYAQALKASPDNAYVYGSWATAAYWLGDYPTAWKYVKKQRALGGQPTERFVKLLSERMAEPRG